MSLHLQLIDISTCLFICYSSYSFTSGTTYFRQFASQLIRLLSVCRLLFDGLAYDWVNWLNEWIGFCKNRANIIFPLVLTSILFYITLFYTFLHCPHTRTHQHTQHPHCVKTNHKCYRLFVFIYSFAFQPHRCLPSHRSQHSFFTHIYR